MALISDGPAWTRRGWQTLKWTTVGGLVLGFLAGTLSLVSGNTISVNGATIGGWSGVWTVTGALGIAGFGFGLIGWLLFTALGIAAGKGR